MSKRERLLAAVIGLLLGFLAIDRLVRRAILAPLEAKRDAAAAAELQLKDLHRRANAAHDAEFDLNWWRKTALPADVSIASACYQDHLRTLLEKAGIKLPNVTPAAVLGRDDRPLEFRVAAKAELGQVIRFLQLFYDSDVLHRIELLRLNPVVADGRIKEIDVSVTIEAMSLSDAVTKTGLPQLSEADRNRRRALCPPEGYEFFVQKNPFQPTRLVEARREREAKGEDRRDYVVRGLLRTDRNATLMVANKKTNSSQEVNQGDYLRVADINAKLVEVLDDHAVLLIDGKLGRVGLGDNLGSWKQLENPTQSQ
jgi:hypothetical protein